MSGLCRSLGHTNVRIVNFYKSISRFYQTNPYLGKKECEEKKCDPEVQRLDDCHPKELKGWLKKALSTAYSSCPPPPPQPSINCGVPPRSRPVKKRKPVLLAAACKKPKSSPSLEVCGRTKVDPCPKMRIPNCPLARNPPLCPVDGRKTCDNKMAYPLPAFSEYLKLPKSTRVDECECHWNRNKC